MSPIYRLTAEMRKQFGDAAVQGESMRVLRDGSAMVAAVRGYLIRIDVEPMGVGPQAEEPLETIAAKVHEVLIDALQRLDDRYVAGESLKEFTARMR